MSERLAFLGPSGTFTHQAALLLRPKAEVYAVPTPGEALAAVADGAARWAVCPIDNTVNGVVVPTLDGLLARPGLAVVDSAVVPISFDAYTAESSADSTGDAGGSPVEPTVVVSHPHGLAQCRGYVESLGVPTREASSTAAACRDLVPGEIGIGPAVCGTLFPIELVAEAVEDNDGAFTQFALVAHEDAPLVGAGGHEGLLVALTPTINVPGLLRRFLEVLERRDVNMTNLVTRPVPATPGIFVFLLFLAGDFSASDFEAMREEWAGLGVAARALGRISPLAELVAARG